jgi:hypothetical protein
MLWYPPRFLIIQDWKSRDSHCCYSLEFTLQYFKHISFSHSGGVESKLGPLDTSATSGLRTCPGWLWGWRTWWNKDWQGKPKHSEKTCPRATLSTTNPTWPDPGANPDRCGGIPATNRLSYGAAKHFRYITLLQVDIWVRPLSGSSTNCYHTNSLFRFQPYHDKIT